MADPAHHEPGRYEYLSDLPVGELAIRVFRAVRKRRLATPPEPRKRPDPGLIAELVRRGWDLPPHLLECLTANDDASNRQPEASPDN